MSSVADSVVGKALDAWPARARFRGRYVELQPLEREHISGLRDAAADGELWRLWYTSIPSPEQAEDYVNAALAARDAGRAIPFAVLDGNGKVVGSTRFFELDEPNGRLEIGWTWYAKSVQRTALNTEVKQLLLTYAFESLACAAVEFRTHWMNHASRAAIARIGAKQDGVLRNHRRMPDGSFRDTVVFSIIESEWPMVRRHLDYLLESRSRP